MQDKLFEEKQITLRSGDGYQYIVKINEDFLHIEYEEDNNSFANHTTIIPAMYAEQIAQTILKLLK